MVIQTFCGTVRCFTVDKHVTILHICRVSLLQISVVMIIIFCHNDSYDALDWILIFVQVVRKGFGTTETFVCLFTRLQDSIFSARGHQLSCNDVSAHTAPGKGRPVGLKLEIEATSLF